MSDKKQGIETDKRKALPPGFLKSLLKQIGNLNRTGMTAGNSGNFDTAFMNMNEAISLSRELDKKCLEAKLLNNLGLLYTMEGAWEKALSAYDRSMELVTEHYGTQNILYKTLQKNMIYLFTPRKTAQQ